MRRFVHYVVLSWAFTMGAMAFAGIGYMMYGLIFLDFASRANFGIY
jgi:hypothetical protein